MTELLQRVCQKAALLKTAYQTHQDAFLAHREASLTWKTTPSRDAAMMLHNTDCARDNARDTILALAEGLLYASQAWLDTLPGHEAKAIRRHTASLQEAFKTADAAFALYSAAADDAAKKHEAFKAAQTEIISRAWPLLERIGALNPCQITMKGITAVWYLDQKDGLEAIGKQSLPPAADSLAVKDEGQIDTDLDGTYALPRASRRPADTN